MRSRRAAAASLTTAVVVWITPWAVSAASIPLFNNMGTPRTSVGSDAASNTTWLAYHFHPTASGKANLISVQAECTSNGVVCQPGSSGTMSIYSDSSGHPGTALGTTGTFNPPLSAPVTGNCLVMPLAPTIHQGTSYWAVMKGTSATFINWLFQDDTAGNNTFRSTDSGATWASEPAGLNKPFTLRIDQGSACGGHLVPNPVAGTTIGGTYVRSGHQDVSTITLSNDGISDLHLTSYSISGGNGAAAFQVLDASVKDSPTPPHVWPQQTTLLSNALVILYVTCTGPPAEGHYTSTLTFKTDDTSNPSISWPLSCFVDNTPPVISYTVTPSGANGWFKALPADVAVSADDGPTGSGTNHLFCSVNGTSSLDTGFSAATMHLGEPPLTESSGNTVNCNAGDVAGNVTPTPATISLKVDTRAPLIVADPVPAPNAAGWNHTTVTVSFRCSDPTPGSGAVTAAVSGGGTFTNETTRAGTTVTSTGACDDVAGNAGVPSSITLKIDKTPPSTRIVSAPPARTNSTTAQFTFAGTDSLSGIAGFACTLDGAPTACAGSSAVFSGLAGGTHKLLVKAMDVAGNVDATGKTATWFVDLTAPVITFTSPHQGDTTEPTGAVHFTVTDPDDATPSTTCALDGQVAAACSSSFTYTGLIAGAHTLVVTARDRAGNSATNTLNFSTAVLSSVSPVHVPSTGAAPRPAGGLVAISAGIAMVMLGVARRRRSRRSG